MKASSVMTRSADVRSNSSRAPDPAWIDSEAMAESRTTSEHSSASSSWKTLRVSVIGRGQSSETAGDVGLCPFVAGGGEDVLGVVELDQDACAGVGLGVDLGGEEGRLVAHPGRLLHVVVDDHDGELGL